MSHPAFLKRRTFVRIWLIWVAASALLFGATVEPGDGGTNDVVGVMDS